MDDDHFLLPVIYKDAEKNFVASMRVLGFTHRFEVDVDGTMVYFERDEEGNYRALIPPEEKGKVPPVDLLQAIGLSIEAILK